MIIMASGHDDWDAQKMLDLYLHDYIMKRKMHKTAAIFRKEAHISNNPVALDEPDGFLHEWWTVFYDIFASRQLKPLEVKARASVKAEPMTHNDQQSFRPIMPRLALTQNRSAGQFHIATGFDKMLGQPATSQLAARMFDEKQHFRQPVRNFDPNLPFLEVSILNSSTSGASSSSYLQQQSYNQAQQLVLRDSRNAISISRAEPSEATFYGVKNSIFPVTRSHDAGVNGVNSASLNRWLSNSLIQAPSNPQQFPVLTEQNQQNPLLGQALSLNSGKLTSAFPRTSVTFPCRDLSKPKRNLERKDAPDS